MHDTKKSSNIQTVVRNNTITIALYNNRFFHVFLFDFLLCQRMNMLK